MANSLQGIALALSAKVSRLRFGPPVTCVYNPLDHAWQPHALYLERYGGGGCEVLMVGMNPGPWGMAQTGIPFGEVAAARDFLGLEAPVDKPTIEHPKRPVEGFACPRSEVSGRRVWGWVQQRFGTPERFFARFFIYNYCPLSFMEESGRNRTPDKLLRAERTPLFEACDEALRQTVELMRPDLVVGVGAFARGRADRALAGLEVRIGQVLHPSPASPLANRGWAAQAEADLVACGIDLGHPEPSSG